MHFPPLLVSLRQHKVLVTLLVLASAFTFGIVVNVASMVAHRLELLNMPSGLNESGLVMFDSSSIEISGQGSDNTKQDYKAQYLSDVAALRAIPGTVSASVVEGLPLSNGFALGIGVNEGMPRDQLIHTSGYAVGPGGVNTLGLHLIQGRDFLPTEYIPVKDFSSVSAAIISRALAERLFHTDDAVGRVFFIFNRPIRVVGIADHMIGTQPELGAADNEFAMALPMEPDGDSATFILRTAPENAAIVLKSATQLMNQREPLRIIDDANTYTELRSQYFGDQTASIWLLIWVGIALLIVTGTGIVGLASYWVQLRTHSIGIRRALGATKMDILKYFHAENFLIITTGITLGVVLAYALNFLFMLFFTMQVLSPVYLVLGALALWVVGQLAVLGPAFRASAIAPVAATRYV
jgi:putative ABC transport system permease protein